MSEMNGSEPWVDTDENGEGRLSRFNHRPMSTMGSQPMTTKPDDVPQDIWDAACEWRKKAEWVNGGIGPNVVIARATMAERERCAKIAFDVSQRQPNSMGMNSQELGENRAAHFILNAIRKG